MNEFLPISRWPIPAEKKAQLSSLLERVCRALSPTETQYQLAKDRYEAVGEWVASSDHVLLWGSEISPQGSFATGTANKPLAEQEFDVDSVSLSRRVLAVTPPADLKRALGDRLRANGHYRPILEEKARCWRLNFAGEFHLDITPSIPNLACWAGGELVPDRELRCWKASNPKGYRRLFEYRASLQPRIRLRKSMATDLRAEVEPFPASMQEKGILRRAVQLAKRHRDIYFVGQDQRLCPISVILTTLVSRSYQTWVAAAEFDSEFDVLYAVIQSIPDYIEQGFEGSKPVWFIWNETTQGENFAEKWNTDPERAEAFFAWHRRLVSDLDRLANEAGLDVLSKSLSTSFGSKPVNTAITAMMDEVAAARLVGTLSVAPIVGLSRAPLGGSPVRKNTFYGAR